MSDVAPELRPGLLARLEIECPLEQRDGIPELIATEGEFRGTTKPLERLLLQSLAFGLLAAPGEVGVLGAHSFGVVVGEQGSAFVPPVSGLLEPGREARVQPCALRLGEARVGDLASERVFDRVFLLAGHR
jgi:hypothetical protein